MCRIDGLGGAAKVLENPINRGLLLDARKHTQPPAAAPAGLDVDREHPLEFAWCYVDLATGRIVPGPLGKAEVFPAPVADPGIGLIAGLQEFQLTDGTPQVIANEILVAIAGPTFKIPTLWGVADTAPYFHDNSAKTLEDVLDQYNFLFSFFPDGPFPLGCDRTRPLCLDQQDKADIIAYLQLLRFDTREDRPAQRAAIRQ
jgi:hypothetical protein